MNLRKCIFTNSECYKRGRTIKPKGIMVHSTGANNPTLRRYVGPDDGQLGRNAGNNHWNMPGLNACVHAFIGKLADGSIATYQTLPWNYRGWHAGGLANNTHISFEICEDGLTDASYFCAVYQVAVELCVYLCKLYGLTEKNIICHSEGHAMGIASGHADVMHWFPRYGKSMDTFRADVSKALKGEEDMTPEEIRTIAREEAAAQTTIYQNLEDIPLWGKPTVEKLIKRGGITGDGDGIDIPYETLRLLVINDRMGLYGGAV